MLIRAGTHTTFTAVAKYFFLFSFISGLIDRKMLHRCFKDRLKRCAIARNCFAVLVHDAILLCRRNQKQAP